jgi:hypothetical protein
MKSHEFLQAAIDVQAERGKQYDKPTGERSMGATISAFNCITGRTLEESDGWLLLSLLKLVRQAQNPEQYHHDSALDFVAYASLYAEAASEQCGQLEAASEPKSNGWQGFEDPPHWANWLGLDGEGAFWFEKEPELNTAGDAWQWPLSGLCDTIDEIKYPIAKYPRPQ